MNCQDISRILDSRDVNALSAGERRSCEAHAASCPRCWPEWVVYTRLAAISDPPMSPELAARCEALASARSTAARGSRSGRTILLGALLATAVAAAMFGLVLRRDVVPQTIAESSVPAWPEGHVSGVSAAEGTLSVTGVPAESSRGRFTVHLSLQYDSADPLALRRVREYYEAIADGLRAIPELQLVDDPAARGAEPSVDFRVSITGLTEMGQAKAAFRDRMRIVTGGDQQGLIPSEWAVMTSVEVLNGERGGPSGPAGTIYGLGMVGDAWRGGSPSGVETRGPLSGDCVTPQLMPCSPADIAERQVMALRKHVFPRDGSLERELEAQFLQPTQSERARKWVMSDLLSLKMTLSNVMVREALARIARPQDPNEVPQAAYDRVNLLELLAGQRHPEILQPLIDIARYDSDVSFRIEAVKLLAADFPTDPAVRVALDEIAADPSTPMLQTVAAGLIRGSPGD
jgi:hypothetical protein